MKKVTIVAFGASVIEGVIELKDPARRWTNLLKKKLDEKFQDTQFDVVNSGVGGESIREAMSRYDRAVRAHSPDYVLLGFGGNNDDPENENRRVSGAEYRNFLYDIKKRLETNRAKIVIMVMPPVIDEQHWAREHPYVLAKGGMDKILERDREISREFAEENNFPVVDLSLRLGSLMRTHPKNYYTLPDGIHLTEKGYDILTDMMFEVLSSFVTLPQKPTF